MTISELVQNPTKNNLISAIQDAKQVGWIRFSFEDLMKLCDIAAEVKGFNDNHVSTGEAIALMHSELSEGLEADRKDLMSDKIPTYTGMEEELADCVIRICHYAGRHKLRLGEAIADKLLFNAYREHMHGGKKY